MSRQLLQAALNYVPNDIDLHAEIATFLGQPVHIGDAIIFRAGYPQGNERDGKEEAEGYSKVPYTAQHPEYDFEKREYTGEMRHYEGTHTRIPEIDPGRSYGWDAMAAGIVVPIHGRLYRVHISIENSDGIPDGATVTFTRTDDEETPYEAFNAEESIAKLIAYDRSSIETSKRHQAEEEAEGELTDEGREYYARDIAESELRIANIESGERVPQPKGPVTFFGQPQFTQNEMRPQLNGKAAYHLATLDTDWGDCGNVNILFACDENGVPAAAWFEASCC